MVRIATARPVGFEPVNRLAADVAGGYLANPACAYCSHGYLRHVIVAGSLAVGDQQYLCLTCGCRRYYSKIFTPSNGGVTPVVPSIYMQGKFIFSVVETPLASPHSEVGAADSLTKIDVNSIMSATGVKLRVNGTHVAGDLIQGTTAFARIAGRAWIFRVPDRTTYPSATWRVYWSSTNDAAQAPIDLYIRPTQTGVQIRTGATTIDTITIAGDLYIALVQRTAGGFLLTSPDGTTWTLQWVWPAGATSPLYTVWGNSAAGVAWDFGLDDWRVYDYPAPWATDYGIATSRTAGSIALNTTYVHTADGRMDFVMTTLPGASGIEATFRQVDANNLLSVTITNTGTFRLWEQVATVYTKRAESLNIVAAGDRVFVAFDGNTIRGYSADVLRWTYTPEPNFLTAVAGKIIVLTAPGVITNFVMWPATPAVPAV